MYVISRLPNENLKKNLNKNFIFFVMLITSFGLGVAIVECQNKKGRIKIFCVLQNSNLFIKSKAYL